MLEPLDGFTTAWFSLIVVALLSLECSVLNSVNGAN